MNTDRRRFLMGLLAGSASLAWTPARAASTPRRPLVMLTLRGGLDGLAAVPAVGDPAFRSARGELGEVEVGPGLDATFALHRSLAAWKELYDDGDLLVVHGVGLPYAQRSHFDAQDLLASGLSRPTRSDSGWLGRGLYEGGDGVGVAVGAGVPLLLRGPEGARRPTSVDPSRRSHATERKLVGVRAALASDPLLGPALEEGLATRATLARLGAGRSRGLADTLAVTARLMALPDGPQVATIDVDGWDTHSRQVPTLERRLAELAAGVVAFRDADPEQWERSMVVVVTEFGRTVRGNGTGGTDHGVGTVAFVLGGAVAGGRVHADWPGLAPHQLVDGRDLRVTTDVRQLFAGALAAQLRLSERSARGVFPGGGGLSVLPLV